MSLKKQNPECFGLIYDLSQLMKEWNLASDAFDYSSRISQNYTIEQERNLLLSETETVIVEMGKKRDVHQLRTYLKHRPVEIRYFILERVFILLWSYMEFPDFLPSAEISGEPLQKLSESLLVFWTQLLDYLSENSIPLNKVVSFVYHGGSFQNPSFLE